jgi:enoyl-CoA hydratase
MSSTVETERRGPVARIWLNRPERHNAQNEELIYALDDAFDVAANDPDVLVIVVAGRGKSFSSGHDLARTIGGTAEADIAELRKTTEGRLQHERNSYYDKCLKIRNCPKPTIAQVHGHCIAAGLMLAAMCDLIIAGESARFSNPVVRMGAVAAEVFVEPWELGVRKAKELLFLGEVLTADEAKQLGLVNRVYPDSELEREVDTIADRIASVPPMAMQLAKESFHATLDAMGQSSSWKSHFMIHQVGHATDEYQQIISPANTGNVKEFVGRRDSGQLS